MGLFGRKRKQEPYGGGLPRRAVVPDEFPQREVTFPQPGSPSNFDPFADDPRLPSAPGPAGAGGSGGSSLGSEWGASGASGARPDLFDWESNGVNDSGLSLPGPTSREKPLIVAVCTGNVCRSPYMERLLQKLVGNSYEVVSAGTGALVGDPMDPLSAKLLEEQGISAQRFISQQLTEDLVADASLILTATRDHRREVVQLAPVGLKKTFALGDLAHAVSELPAEAVKGAPGRERLVTLLEAVELYRPQLNVLPAESVDIVDPFKEDETVFRTMQKQTDPQVQMLARGLVG